MNCSTSNTCCSGPIVWSSWAPTTTTNSLRRKWSIQWAAVNTNWLEIMAPPHHWRKESPSFNLIAACEHDLQIIRLQIFYSIVLTYLPRVSSWWRSDSIDDASSTLIRCLRGFKIYISHPTTVHVWFQRSFSSKSSIGPLGDLASEDVCNRTQKTRNKIGLAFLALLTGGKSIKIHFHDHSIESILKCIRIVVGVIFFKKEIKLWKKTSGNLLANQMMMLHQRIPQVVCSLYGYPFGR